LLQELRGDEMSYEMRVDLGGRRVVVTGAAGGIGSALVRRLAQSGASVFALDLVERDGVVHCDVSLEDEVEEAFRLAGAGGEVTDVVHASGICKTSPILETSLTDWEKILSVNLTGSFLVGREAARNLPDGGTIVFVGSVAGLTGDPFFGAYCASKFGVTALTEVLARELGHRRIRVNAVCPGGVRTNFSAATLRRDAERLGRSEDELRSLYQNDVFLHRWADPEEIADACLFLLSPASRYVSGHSLVLNGGGNLSSHR
jgi:NAD(P)-dependent dehydrogenase (short-subunit alcohol dehydrogenase family)